MADTTIEWTDKTWNPIRGCTAVSPGCENCYAQQMAHRFSGPGKAFEGLTRLTEHGPKWTGKMRVVPEKLEEPLHWRKPSLVFVNSMSDLLHKDVPAEYIAETFDVMKRADWHRFQVLTKRPERLAEVDELLGKWSENVWMGVSVENDDYTDRIDLLRASGAVVKFLSLEPLLGPLSDLDLYGIDWVIVGGESGPGARPMNIEWVREIRD
jgi:protein gp37